MRRIVWLVGETPIRSKIAELVARVMQAAQIPISVWPFWYQTVRENRGSYRPFLQLWREDADFRKIWEQEEGESLVFRDTAYMLFGLARLGSTHEGEIWECGVYRGATAKLLAAARDGGSSSGRAGSGDSSCSPKTIRLFDTFAGIPERRTETDSFEIGSLGDTSLGRVKAKLAAVENVAFHLGFIPDTFKGLEDRIIAFAHVDVDQYETTKQCCRFVYPRLSPGGVMVIDDYGRPGTIGARLGADEYFGPLNVRPVALHTGQAVIIK